jgi:uncharacterized protein YeaO (DUF488 family)
LRKWNIIGVDAMSEVVLKRVYDTPDKSDGCRILVDRLWPRGLSKERANVDLWLKEAAPSVRLRKWFKHDRARWGEFKKRYRKELNTKREAVSELKRIVEQNKIVTLLFAASDIEYNNAVALKSILRL